MEFNIDALTVRWKAPKEKEWRGAYNLSEQWKGKKVYVFIAMRENGSSVECGLFR